MWQLINLPFVFVFWRHLSGRVSSSFWNEFVLSRPLFHSNSDWNSWNIWSGFLFNLGKKQNKKTIKDWTFNHLLLSLLSVMKTTLFYFIHQCKLCNCSGLHSGEFRWLTGSRLFSVAVEMILQDPGSVKSTRRRIHTKAKNTSENILDKVPKDWASSDRLPDGLSLRWERWSSTLVWGRHQVCRQEPVTRQERKNVRKEDKRKEREEKRREQVRKKEQTNK